MGHPLDGILDHLRPLIACNTCNPPRKIDGEGPLVTAVRQALPDFRIAVRDLGEGSVVIDAVRGQPEIFFNVHLDTVPVAPGWSMDPHRLTIGEDRAFGLGTCDTKGAAAILFALARSTDHAMRLVLTTDEEAGQSRCVRSLLEDASGAGLAVIAEPTDGLARLGHRGLVSARTRFAGRSAHASEAGGRSAVHRAARFITAALGEGFAEENRLNFGRIEGGQKPNMIAAEAEILLGFRCRAGKDHNDILARLEALAGEAVTPRFVGPALPSDEEGASARAQAAARRIAEELDLQAGPDVDFWTEASLFSAAGIPAIVLGAGSISQAHNADEFVTFDQLVKVHDAYGKVLARYG